MDLFNAIAEGALLFTFIFLLKRIYDLTDLFATGSTSLMDTFQLLFSILPTIMLLTFPMAILLASMMVYGRIAQENELTALQAAGYSTHQLLVPALILGILLTGLLLWWANRIAPKGLRVFDRLAASIFEDTTSTGIRPGGFNELGEYIIVPSEIDSSNVMHHVRMFEVNKNKKITTTISAPTSTIKYEPLKNSIYLNMENGNIYKISEEGNSLSIFYETFDFSISVERLLRNLAPVSRDEFKLRNADLRFIMNAYQNLPTVEQQDNSKKRLYFRSVTELHRRHSLPFACLIMALLGALLGIISGRGKRSSCYAISITIIFVYYILMNFGKNFVHSDLLPGWLGLWIPNLISILIGIYLYYRTYRV